jgi:hypothetical protein
MKYVGGILLLLYTAALAFGFDRMPDEDRGKLPPGVRSAPGGILMWHSGFMGGK